MARVRRRSIDELRAFLENLPLPTNRNGYQAGVVHALAFAVRGIEPDCPEWRQFTGKRNKKATAKKNVPDRQPIITDSMARPGRAPKGR